MLLVLQAASETTSLLGPGPSEAGLSAKQKFVVSGTLHYSPPHPNGRLDALQNFVPNTDEILRQVVLNKRLTHMGDIPFFLISKFKRASKATKICTHVFQ